MRILALKERILAAKFSESHWTEIGFLTGQMNRIEHYPRLLRSLKWGDPDYADCVLGVLRTLNDEDESSIDEIENYLSSKTPNASEFISAVPKERVITFAPTAFEIPKAGVDSDLASVMMPFDAAFTKVYEAIRKACKATRFRPERADNVWEHSTIIQDVFELIFTSKVVIVDFTHRNPNVMYETGIAHALGKIVIPISQSIDDVPFDTRHHRVLKYLPNAEGLEALTSALTDKLSKC